MRQHLVNPNAPEFPTREIGIVIVDHGSRREASNDLLQEVVAMFVGASPYSIVEPAHMEIAEPSVATAFDRCVARGAKAVVIFPYFLSPGRHWSQDIPALAAAAAQRHADVRYLVTAPLGLHPLMAQIMNQRIDQCWAHARGSREACDICLPASGCRWLTAETGSLSPPSEIGSS